MRAAVLFDLDCTLVDRLYSIRQYAIQFAEDFRSRLVPTSVEHIAVGDHSENDILGASRAGLQTVWLAGVQTWPAEHALPHHQIGSLRELVPLIRAEISGVRSS